MSDKSSIEWTDATWNPTVGCSIVSPGCTNCYAMKVANGLERRFNSTKYRGLTKIVNGNAVWTGEVRLDEVALLQPLKWKKHRRIFVNSMSDLFHEKLTDEQIDRVFAVMSITGQHTYQVLTKRADRMRSYMLSRASDTVYPKMAVIKAEFGPLNYRVEWPPHNVWLGVSCERQQEADERIPLLLQTPAAVRFISAEPLLGAIDLNATPLTNPTALFPNGEPALCQLDWVIVGGESGLKAREHDLQWSRNIIAQCKAAGVAVFEKQLGSAAFSAKDRITYRGCKNPNRPQGFSRYLNHNKGGDWSEWPEDLRIREFPQARS